MVIVDDVVAPEATVAEIAQLLCSAATPVWYSVEEQQQSLDDGRGN